MDVVVDGMLTVVNDVQFLNATAGISSWAVIETFVNVDGM